MSPGETNKSGSDGPPRGGGSSLLDAVFDATQTAAEEAAAEDWLNEFLAQRSPQQALRVWLLSREPEDLPADTHALARQLQREVAGIDRLLNSQTNAILHHRRFQELEATWRGLRYLVECADQDSNIQIRVLNVSWQALVRDLDRAIEFDQNQLFKKVYSGEFGTSGGEPFSVLLGDYEVRPRPERGSPTDDMAALSTIKEVAAAAFAPFVAAAHPTMLGMDRFLELQRPGDLGMIYQQPEFGKWHALRDATDSRFIGLVLPRILMREPYRRDSGRADGFLFHENTDRPGGRDYLWGNAVYAFGGVLLRAFAESRWLADIRGVEPGVESKGLVTGLPSQSFGVDALGVAHKSSTEVIVTDSQEADLSELGFLPLCHCRETGSSAFYSSSSVHRPQEYDDPLATANAKISSMLQYMLCVSRLAHYLKVLGREKVGSFDDASDVEGYLNDWLQQYVTQDDEAPPDVKAQYPLREAVAEVREYAGQPGNYYCTIQLQPHYQLDGMSSSMKLTTELAVAKG